MTRVHSFTNALSIWVYTDHMPPQFHIPSPNSSALVDLRTLEVMRAAAIARSWRSFWIGPAGRRTDACSTRNGTGLMRGTDGSSTFSVGEPLPNIAAVEASEGLSVSVAWADDTRPRATVDLAPDILTFKSYAPLRDDPELFRTVHVINGGSALGWGADDRIDMPATAIERLADEVMSTADFQAFLKRTNLTRDAAAAQSGSAVVSSATTPLDSRSHDTSRWRARISSRAPPLSSSPPKPLQVPPAPAAARFRTPGTRP